MLIGRELIRSGLRPAEGAKQGVLAAGCAARELAMARRRAVASALTHSILGEKRLIQPLLRIKRGILLADLPRKVSLRVARDGGADAVGDGQRRAPRAG